MYQEPKKLAELQLEFETFVVISTRVKEDLDFLDTFRCPSFVTFLPLMRVKFKAFKEVILKALMV